MYLQNLELEQINVDDLKSELLSEVDSTEMPTEQEVKNALAEMYQQAANATAPMYYNNAESFIAQKSTNYSLQLAGNNIWERIRKYFCEFLNQDSTAGDIIDAILDFLASIIPGGIIIKLLVKKIVKYFLNMGYEALCPIA